MAKQVKIKDIAQKAGVSAGTVDRILHNRGNVSPKSREAVEKVLAQTGYRYNIHTSAVSLKKTYKLIIAIPTAVKGEYWGFVRDGIEHALEEYSDIKIDCEYSYYDQFDVFSCKESFQSIPQKSPNAVIIGATFASETVKLCEVLDNKHIPYAFVDAVIENTSPAVTYSSDQNICGRIVGRLLNLFTPRESNIAVFGSRRTGNERADNSMRRMQGLMEYFQGVKHERVIKEAKMSANDTEEAKNDIIRFLEQNPDVGGIAVLNSRGHIAAEALKESSFHDIKIISFDLTDRNVECVKEGSISAIICQRPELQGFHAVTAMIHILLYNPRQKEVHHLMPADIVLKENLPLYKEIYTE